MAEIVPVDQLLDWYPGWKPEHIDDPWLRMKSGPFTKEDESRFWFVDFHWPRGFSPLGFPSSVRRRGEHSSRPNAATVSREYGIPCVVGTSVATLRIKTGDLIEVDGTRGVVTIVERAATA